MVIQEHLDDKTESKNSGNAKNNLSQPTGKIVFEFIVPIASFYIFFYFRKVQVNLFFLHFLFLIIKINGQ